MRQIVTSDLALCKRQCLCGNVSHSADVFLSAREATRYQFIIDLLDIWIPASNIGLVNFNDGILGIFGSVLTVQNYQRLEVLTFTC